MTPTEDFASLFDTRFLSVVSFRRNGDEVATPVWTVELDGTLYVRTDASCGKVKRLRRDSRVLLAACTFRGKETAPRVNARGRLLDVSERPDVVPALDAKYGLLSRAAGFAGRLRRRTPIIIELVPAPVAESAPQAELSAS
jgi:PPOX class probable F420-dependent enzyme